MSVDFYVSAGLISYYANKFHGLINHMALCLKAFAERKQTRSGLKKANAADGGFRFWGFWGLFPQQADYRDVSRNHCLPL